MAERNQKPAAAHHKAEKAGRPAKEAKKKSALPAILAIVVIIIAAAAIGYIFVVPQLLTGSVQFSSFKSTFQSAQRVSVTASYGNETQYTNESPCFSSIIQIIAHTRKASTIDFFLVNRANATCTYSKTGLGGSVVPQQINSSYCLGIADSEPGIFLNYSSVNGTHIMQTHLYAYGNSAYMASCPIAIELS